jgi:hypothetical protein
MHNNCIITKIKTFVEKNCCETLNKRIIEVNSYKDNNNYFNNEEIKKLNFWVRLMKKLKILLKKIYIVGKIV